MGVDKKVGERKKRWIITIRTAAQTRQRLHDAADLMGRSLTQEIESRLEMSFLKDDWVGGPATTALLHLIGAGIKTQEVLSGQSWDCDERTRAATKQAIISVIDAWAGPKEASLRLADASGKPKRSKKIGPKDGSNGS